MASISVSGPASCNTIKANIVPDVTETLTVSLYENGVLSTSQSISFTAGQLSVVSFANANGYGGVYEVTMTDGNGAVTSGYIVMPCKLECCIADEFVAALECGCDCDGCSKHFKKAERVLMLLTAAKAAVAQAVPNYDSAIKHYNKAKEMCASTCDCGC